MSVLAIDNETTVEAAVKVGSKRSRVEIPAAKDADLAVELGIWLSGLESFVSGGYRAFRVAEKDTSSDTVKEFELTRSVLLRCASLNSRLMASGFLNSDSTIASDRHLAGLGRFFRDSILLGECIIRSNSVGIAEWEAWSRSLAERMAHLGGAERMIRLANAAGDEYLPEVFSKLSTSSSGHAELSFILPRFGRVLCWLNVVGTMLRNDEPLKPALVVFSSVNEQVLDLVNSINNRLERVRREENDTFSALDAAAYTAALELKKVYTHELAGLARLRPSPTIYARVETAYALLNDGFQQMLGELGRSLDKETDAMKLFPDLVVKFDRSVKLRQDLSHLAEVVRAAETKPEKPEIDVVHRTVREFMVDTVKFLFYKDTETVERFVEEILVAQHNKDLVPILHRFSAYLDTLSGQVSLRAVLANEPFQG